LTAVADDASVWKTLLAVAAASLALAASGSAAVSAGLPPGWTHAEINFFVNGAPHTLVLDRGRVTAVAPTSLTLREADGSSVQIALDASTQVVVDGRSGQLTDLRRGEIAMTQRIDGGPARLVRVHVPPRLARLARR
jgi:hypothetical protein